MRNPIRIAVGLAALVGFAACVPVHPPPPPPPSPPPSFGSMHVGWQMSNINGPVAADPAENLLWAVNKGADQLDELNATSGAVTTRGSISLDSNQHFPTPAVTPNWVFVESSNHVAAFSTPAAPTTTSWVSTALDGSVVSRPLPVNSIVVVATENDSLYGLNVADGTIAWGPINGTTTAAAAGFGPPETLAHLHTLPQSSCGDLDPLGVTSNVVLDNGVAYAVGEVQTGTTNTDFPVHKLIGINPATGAVTLGPHVVDPSTMNPTQTEQQRAGLVATNNRVYIGFGGLAGDCGTYHGWLVAANESDGSIAADLEIAPAPANAAAIWGTSGPIADSSHNVYASTGNAFNDPSSGTDYSDAVVNMGASMSGHNTVPTDFFQPTEWKTDNNNDADLGSAGPAFVSSTQLFILGKQHNAFLLNLSSLGGSNHETPAARLNGACSGEVFGQNAFLSSTNAVYIACSNGITQILLS